MPTSLGIVVIGRNEGERLRRCLSSLGTAVDRAVYVDSGSTDGSVELARALGAEVVELDMSVPFTAARARNAGFRRLCARLPELKFVQFVDGDCEVEAGWLAAGRAALEATADVAVVYGRRRERDRDASPYNRACDLEWDVPIGEVTYCGGDALMRASLLRELGGYDETLIAGEEPDLCFRLRQAGWRILRIDAPMTVHDAALRRFGQWWRRAVRAGYVEAEGLTRHGFRYPRWHEALSHLAWTIGLPLTAAAAAALAISLQQPAHLVVPLALLLVVQAHAALWLRIRARARRRWSPPDAACYATFCLLAKWPGVQGMFTYWWRQLRSAPLALIEYKDIEGVVVDLPRGGGTLPGTLGIVVIARNEGERFRRCLDSLDGHRARIVYVDSGSTDGSPELARSRGIEVVDLDRSRPFTAARARNEGLQRLLERCPDLHWVQFVDGDCEVEPGWLQAGMQLLEARANIAVVFGRCRERHRDQSFYNRACDLEWDVPVGPAESCGGNAMMRLQPLREVGGYDPTLIAGEEPDLCYRMRQRGWLILRVAEPMVVHDAAIHSFGQWWRRAVRAGYVEAEGLARRGERYPRLRQAWSHLGWGLCVPLLALAGGVAAWATGAGVAAVVLVVVGMPLVAYAALWARIRHNARRRWNRGDAACYATFCVLAKWPAVQGMFTFWWRRWRGRTGQIIEYKRPGPATAAK